MEITYYGHSSFLVEIYGKKVLFDPFISPNEKASLINIDEIEADYILLTHGHQDHCADLLSIAMRTGAQLISNFELVTYFGKQGVSNSLPMNHGGTWKLDFGSVKYVTAIHSSSLPDGSYAGNPGGFVVESREGNFYYSGDTALTYDMKLIGEYHQLDFAFMCIGDVFTMGYQDAIIASDFVGCDTVIGMHYDTFGYIKIDHEAAKQAFRDKGKKLILAKIGETFSL